MIPVTNEVSATDSISPPTSLRRCGFAQCVIASAAAGSANIMIGKNPVRNCPALGSPARKRLMSPCTMSPSAALKSPNWNHTNVFRNWCSPTTSSARFATPNTPEPHAPASDNHSPKLVSPSPIGCHAHAASPPSSSPMNAIRIGTSRRPLKKPSQSTSFVR
ncbi:hypothetical protein GA0115246_1138716 [Streptomyces sp. SolWspMP-sol7th]|nr:hypothetical protein GA0115246_1138716 [Streptomyces sp. SolWspMP-sol7th]